MFGDRDILKVFYLVTLYIKYTRALIFQNFFKVTVTSVVGHVHTLDFDGNHQRGDPANLYTAATKKVAEETSEEHGIEAHLVAAAQDCHILFLWLDCDREGENICYEVIQVCRKAGLFVDDASIFRAKFSALTESHIKAAWQQPGKPFTLPKP